MKILEYLTPERVKLHLNGKTKKEIIKEVAQLFVKSGVTTQIGRASCRERV